jgi:hypothetical protein
MSALQISPATRHPSSSSQRIPTHSVPQQSGLCMQASPAGRHIEPGGGGGGPAGWATAAAMTQEPAVQSLLQQSMLWVQRAPATAHAGPAAHRGAPPSTPATQASVQHCPANEHAAPTGWQSFAGPHRAVVQ